MELKRKKKNPPEILETTFFFFSPIRLCFTRHAAQSTVGKTIIFFKKNKMKESNQRSSIYLVFALSVLTGVPFPSYLRQKGGRQNSLN